MAPNIGPEYVTEILGSLEEALWYVHREGDSLKFQTRPNVYRVIAQTAEGQPDLLPSPNGCATRSIASLERLQDSEFFLGPETTGKCLTIRSLP